MPEHRLKPSFAIGGAVPTSETIGALSIRENGAVAIASVAARRGRSGELSAVTQQAFGLSLPEISRFSRSGPLRMFWTAPEQWLFEAPVETHEDIERALKPAFGDCASVTEQTGGIVALEVEGETCLALFERLCNADVKRMAPGDVVRSSIEHLSTYILCNEAGRSFSLRGAASSAVSLHHAVVTMARSIA